MKKFYGIVLAGLFLASPLMGMVTKNCAGYCHDTFIKNWIEEIGPDQAKCVKYNSANDKIEFSRNIQFTNLRLEAVVALASVVACAGGIALLKKCKTNNSFLDFIQSLLGSVLSVSAVGGLYGSYYLYAMKKGATSYFNRSIVTLDSKGITCRGGELMRWNDIYDIKLNNTDENKLSIVFLLKNGKELDASNLSNVFIDNRLHGQEFKDFCVLSSLGLGLDSSNFHSPEETGEGSFLNDISGPIAGVRVLDKSFRIDISKLLEYYLLKYCNETIKAKLAQSK